MTKYIRAIILITLMSIVLLIGYKQGYDKSAATYKKVISTINDTNTEYFSEMSKYGGLYALQLHTGNGTTTSFILNKQCKPVLTDPHSEQIDFSSPKHDPSIDKYSHEDYRWALNYFYNFKTYDEYTFVCTK